MARRDKETKALSLFTTYLKSNAGIDSPGLLSYPCDPKRQRNDSKGTQRLAFDHSPPCKRNCTQSREQRAAIGKSPSLATDATIMSCDLEPSLGNTRQWFRLLCERPCQYRPPSSRPRRPTFFNRHGVTLALIRSARCSHDLAVIANIGMWSSSPVNSGLCRRSRPEKRSHCGFAGPCLHLRRPPSRFALALAWDTVFGPQFSTTLSGRTLRVPVGPP